jgi:hypothetical protein
MKGARSKEGGNQKDQKYKQVNFDFDEAHAGVPKEMLDKRKKKKLRGRCGYSNHIWNTCQSPKP